MQKREKSLEIVDIVDENDKVIGQDTLQNVHNKGLWHRAVHVFVFSPSGKLFIQQRSRHKFILPLHWDSSAAEHMQAGETYEQGALRGLEEELGISGVEVGVLVKKRFVNKVAGKYDNREFIQLFRCIYDKNVDFDRRESEIGGFYGIDEIKEMIKSKKNNFVSIFLEFFNWYIKNKKGK